MKRTGSLGLCFVGSLCLSVVVIAQQPNLSSPEATVRSFVTGYEQADLHLAANCIQGGQYTTDIRTWEKGLRWSRQLNQWPLFEIVNIKPETDDVVLVTYKVRNPNIVNRDYTFSERLRLRQVGTNWKIIPASVKALTSSAESADLPPLQDFAARLAHPEVIREVAHLTECQTKLKQITTSILRVIQDHDYRFMWKTKSLEKEITPQLGFKLPFHCPADTVMEPNYYFNQKLEGIAQGEIKYPEKTVMFYEGRGGMLTFRHNGRSNIGFVDGHIKAVDQQEAKQLLWKPE